VGSRERRLALVVLPFVSGRQGLVCSGVGGRAADCGLDTENPLTARELRILEASKLRLEWHFRVEDLAIDVAEKIFRKIIQLRHRRRGYSHWSSLSRMTGVWRSRRGLPRAGPLSGAIAKRLRCERATRRLRGGRG